MIIQLNLHYKKTLDNTMSLFLVEVFNNPDAFGTDGSGEFDWIANHIVAHDEMVEILKPFILW